MQIWIVFSINLVKILKFNFSQNGCAKILWRKEYIFYIILFEVIINNIFLQYLPLSGLININMKTLN